MAMRLLTVCTSICLHLKAFSAFWLLGKCIYTHNDIRVHCACVCVLQTMMMAMLYIGDGAVSESSNEKKNMFECWTSNKAKQSKKKKKKGKTDEHKWKYSQIDVFVLAELMTTRLLESHYIET